MIVSSVSRGFLFANLLVDYPARLQSGEYLSLYFVQSCQNAQDCHLSRLVACHTTHKRDFVR